MAEVIKMPKLSDAMSDGVIVHWYKKIGDKVKIGDVLAETETDKANHDLESEQEGILLYTIAKGQRVDVNSVIAILGEKGENISELLKKENLKSQVGVTPHAFIHGNDQSEEKLEVSIENLKCSNCGANLSVNNTICGYCSTENIIRYK